MKKHVSRRYTLKKWQEIRYAYTVFEELIGGFAKPMSVILFDDGSVTVMVVLKSKADEVKFNRCF